MKYWKVWIACGLLMSLPAAAHADIFRWDNGQLIPGTQRFTPGPRMNLISFNTPLRNLRFADFSGGLDLTEANFVTSWLDDSRFNGANLTRATLSATILTNADLSGANLTQASMAYAILANANFEGAVVAGADFYRVDAPLGGSGITILQLYSTASYQQRNLRGIGLIGHDLTSGDFSGQDLTGAAFNRSILTSANFGGAVVADANFARELSGEFPDGITIPQLYSTASYQQKNLQGIGLSSHDLTSGDFSGQDLTGAAFFGSTLTNANLSGTNLTDAHLGASFISPAANLTNANFAGAVIAGASFYGTTSHGLTKEQLYSTASYQQRNLRGVRFEGDNVTGWDFSGQDLAGADFSPSQLTNVNFSFADLRGAQLSTLETIPLTRNTIREYGAINGLHLSAGETLVVRDSDIGITVNHSMQAVSGGVLELVLADAEWGSTIAVAAGVTPDLGGTLRVRFADQANLASMVGTTFDFFHWPAALEANNRFDAIELPPGTQWDFSQLYVTGAATLTAIPEPSAILLLACGAAACAVARLRVRNGRPCPQPGAPNVAA